MFDHADESRFNAIARQRDATMVSIATGAAMLGAALHQLEQIDDRLAQAEPGVRAKLEEDREKVGIFVAELVSKFLPPGPVHRPRDGIRPLSARVSDADALIDMAKHPPSPPARGLRYR